MLRNQRRLLLSGVAKIERQIPKMLRTPEAQAREEIERLLNAAARHTFESA
jgi:hypothetical protein